MKGNNNELNCLINAITTTKYNREDIKRVCILATSSRSGSSYLFTRLTESGEFIFPEEWRKKNK